MDLRSGNRPAVRSKPPPSRSSRFLEHGAGASLARPIAIGSLRAKNHPANGGMPARRLQYDAADDDEKGGERSHFFLPYQTRLTTQVATAAAAATNKSRKQK